MHNLAVTPVKLFQFRRETPIPPVMSGDEPYSPRNLNCAVLSQANDVSPFKIPMTSAFAPDWESG